MSFEVARLLKVPQALHKGTEKRLFGASSTLGLLIALVDLDALLLEHVLCALARREFLEGCR